MKEFAGKILMLVENPFPQDSRVRNEATTLTRFGYKVFVITTRWENQSFKEEVEGVTVYRIPRINLFKKGFRNVNPLARIFYFLQSTVGYIFEYFYFTFCCLLLSLYVECRHGFQVLHTHNPPNTLFVVGLVHKLFAKKYVFDHHDLSPELFLSRYNKDGGLIYRLLMLEEKICLRLADRIIATNESYKQIEIKRGYIKSNKIFIVRNGPDLENWQTLPADTYLKSLGKIILLYVGIMGPQDGVDYLLKSLSYLANHYQRTDFYTIIVGTGDVLEDLKIMSSKLGLEKFVHFTGYIPKIDLMRYLSTADICLDPNPSSPLNDHSTWIKVMEYMVYGKPTVSFDLKETRYTAQQAAIYVPPNSIEDYAQAIMQLMDDPDKRDWMGAFGLKRIQEKLAWQHVSKNLILLYQSLLTDHRVHSVKPHQHLKSKIPFWAY
jgi:glycosyltransferase involved in cell wall biosynthesis